MHRTRIKICGVRRLNDALHAARAGADAIGLVCHRPAGRYVDAESASSIVAAMSAFVTPVALFVNPGMKELIDVSDQLGVHCVQLHGDETPAFVVDVRSLVLKAIRVDRSTFEQTLDTWRSAIAAKPAAFTHLKGIILESAGPGHGGTGQANDWSYIADVARRGGFEGLPPIIAAGGLTPDNVGEVIGAIRPWAVDVSSGVERVKGEKDHAFIDRFVAAVREADADR